MPRYSGTGVVNGSKDLGTVEAKSEEEAREKFFNGEGIGGYGDKIEADVILCHQCSGDCEDPSIEEIVVYREDDQDE